MEAAKEISRVLANVWLRKYKEKFSSQTEQHLLINSIYCLLYGEPHLNTQGCSHFYRMLRRGAYEEKKLLYRNLIFLGGFFIFFVLYSALLHLPPLRFHCAGGCWDRTKNRWHWQSDALTTRLDLIRTRLDLIRRETCLQ